MTTGAVAAAAVAIAQAIKACGVLVQVEPDEFLRIVDRQAEPLVVWAEGSFFSPRFQYLCSYRGLAFHARSSVPLSFLKNVELVQTRKIYIPG